MAFRNKQVFLTASFESFNKLDYRDILACHDIACRENSTWNASNITIYQLSHTRHNII